MLKKRLIPVLLLQEGMLVRSEKFSLHQIIGTPVHEVKRFNEWNVDELIYLDITRNAHYDLGREDHGITSLQDRWSILDAISLHCFMPLTFGGRIRTVEDMREVLRRGADKVAINSEAFRRPELIAEGARRFGSQAIVVSIDVNDAHEVMIDGGRTATGRHVLDWLKEAESLGAGEILLQHTTRDGAGTGYDTDLIANVCRATKLPVIACSGVGRYEDYVAGIQAGASAVAAANIWHFKEMADRGGRRALKKAGVDVRL